MVVVVVVVLFIQKAEDYANDETKGLPN